MNFSRVKNREATLHSPSLFFNSYIQTSFLVLSISIVVRTNKGIFIIHRCQNRCNYPLCNAVVLWFAIVEAAKIYIWMNRANECGFIPNSNPAVQIHDMNAYCSAYRRHLWLNAVHQNEWKIHKLSVQSSIFGKFSLLFVAVALENGAGVFDKKCRFIEINMPYIFQ